MMNFVIYPWAESLMKEGHQVARKAWPAGKVAYFDNDGDGLPDRLEEAHSDFVRNEMWRYDVFLAGICISIDGVYQPDAYITQEDTLANDWYKV